MQNAPRYLVAALVALATTASAARAQEAPIRVRVQNQAVPAGGSYFQPMNRDNNTIQIYSFDRTTYTVDNPTAQPVTITSLTVRPLDDGQPEEWRLLDGTQLSRPKLEVKDQVIPAQGNWSFVLEFFPVRGDERRAEVELRLAGGGSFKFTARGKGRPQDARFSPHARLDWATCFGGDTTDELTTGLASDEQGNLYVSGNVAQVINKFAQDVYVARVNADGELAWLRGWSGDFQDFQRDPGQNSESGGGAGAIACVGGHVYLALSHSPTSANSVFHATVVKLRASDGELVWQRAWGPKAGVQVARESSEAYALDVADGRVYVTGVVEGDAQVLFLALDDASGDVVFQKRLEVAVGSNDRGYAVRVDGHGGAYLGGLTNGRGLIAHLTGVREGQPQVAWVKKLSMGVGSNVNHIDVDAAGNAYLSCDRRGAQTAFSVIRVDRDGQVAWAKTMNANDRGAKNTCHVVRVAGDTVYAAGKVGVAWYDTQFGDGFLAALDRESGAQRWAALYFGGKGAEEMAEHRLKGLALTGDGQLLVAGQVYTNPNDHHHFWGHWYLTEVPQADYKDYTLEDWTAKATLVDVDPTFGVRDVGALESWNGHLDLKTGQPLGEGLGVMTYQPLRENSGNAPDGDAFLMRLRLGPEKE